MSSQAGGHLTPTSYSSNCRPVMASDTRYTASARTAKENTASYSSSIVECVSVAATAWRLLSRSLATVVSAGFTIRGFSRCATIRNGVVYNLFNLIFGPFYEWLLKKHKIHETTKQKFVSLQYLSLFPRTSPIISHTSRLWTESWLSTFLPTIHKHLHVPVLKKRKFKNV
jgi:hypothetical protein